MCGRDHCRTCNEIPKGRAVTDRDSLTVTHSLAEKIEAISNEWEQGSGSNIEKKLEELGAT